MTVPQITQLYMRLPFFVNCVEVTDENMATVATWCGGTIVGGSNRRYIFVPVIRPTHKRQTEAYVGMYVVLSTRENEPTFKVYTKEWLEKNFTPIPSEITDIFGMPGITMSESYVIAQNPEVRSPAPNHGDNVRALPAPRKVNPVGFRSAT